MTNPRFVIELIGAACDHEVGGCGYGSERPRVCRPVLDIPKAGAARACQRSVACRLDSWATCCWLGAVRAPSTRRRRRGPSRSSSGGLAGEVGVRAHQVGGRTEAERVAAPDRVDASCGSPSWMADRKVPGQTQFTRMPSRAYSTAATLASWITAALVAQYGAECDQAVRPATDAVSTIEPEPCGRMTPTAARMPFTAPRTLTRNERSQSSADRLWIRPFGGGRRRCRPARRGDRSAQWRGPPRPHVRGVTDVGQQRLQRTVGRGEAGDGRLERRGAEVAQHQFGGRLAPASCRDNRRSRARPPPGDDDDPPAGLRGDSRRRRSARRR